MTTLPPTSEVRRADTHRLIPSQYSDGGDSVLTRLADDDAHLKDLFDLDGATNDRLLAENERRDGVSGYELVYGVPSYRIINAAFTHPHPLGSRFNGPSRGAWYAGFELRTAQAEVSFHKTTHLAEVGRFEDEVTLDDYLADFRAVFHDLRPKSASNAAWLDPDSYVESQGVAEQLLEAGSSGVVYPSVRRFGGTCIACFRPALVTGVRRAKTYLFRWSGAPTPTIKPM